MKNFFNFFVLPAIFGLSRWLPFEGQKTSMHFDNGIHIHQVHSCAGRKPSRMKVRQDPPALPGYNGKQGGERFRTILKYPLATDKAMKRHRDIVDDYQKPLDKKRVAQIAAAFDENIANEPKVSYRNGKNYVFDGQHTVAALILRNGGRPLKITCKVYHDLTVEDEATETVARKRKQGEGTLRLRKDGRWEGRIVVGYGEKGAPITKSVTAVSKVVCQEKLEELKVKCGVVRGRAKPDMPFGEWIDLWYQTWSKPGLRITTQQCYEDRIYHHIIPHIGEIPLNKLTQSDLQQFYAELKRNGRRIRRDLYGPGLSDRMVRSCHTTCRIALEKAKTEGLIRVNPAVGCKLPPKKAREMQVLSHEEMQRFLIQAKEDGFYEMMLLELATGMRRGEICALQWDDLNLRTGELHIQRQVIHVAGALHESAPKTKSSDRIVILPPAVLAVLRGLKERTDSQWMFPSPVKEDAPLDPQSVYRKMKKVLVRAQCKNIRFHDLRHTFATTALEHGMDVKTLSAIIGHISSATTIDIYSHITGAMQQQAAQKIERGIGHSEAYEAHETLEDQLPAEGGKPPVSPPFAPYKGKVRKPVTGGIYELNDHLFEGRYSPTNAQGKREVHTVYAKTKEECEELLEKMIAEVRARIKEERQIVKE